ncbi:uncharacterized protein LOC130645009 isoform X4 [Hydractinia symbiolongicarpus]|uniref:uncharacterized protein LOC130645009 isoform X4 n=1 Tax=Hydractinia symbiolongicarpus TaxID=13093 RepID=UPI00254B41E3|nr:uncharacterized protein LOC130645009 isoform X4 [Hydractinia symbiolongicarpus]
MYFLAIFIVLNLSSFAACKDDHPVATYFGRMLSNGKLLNRNSDDYDKDIKKPFVNHILASDTTASLKVLQNNIKNGGKVTVLWNNVEKVQPKDFIAFYCPAFDNPNHYLDYFYVTQSPDWNTGNGKHTVKVYNMRSTCVFKYYRAGGTYSQLVAVSQEIYFNDGGFLAPLQGHIAMTTKPTEMRVMWNSGEVHQPTVVKYGASKDLPLSEYETIVHTYTADSMCMSPANSTGFWHPGFTYDVLLKDLKPNTQYYYSYGTKGAYIWEQWFYLIEPYATLVPYMVGLGNHEQDHTSGGVKDPSHAPGEGGFRPSWFNGGDDSGGECGVPMYKRFHMPDNGNAVWWYSYDFGLVHFIMMSTEHDYSPGSRQYKWLENDLRNVNRSLTPWVIIGGHRAMYCSESIKSDYIVSVNMQRLFEDLLYKYRVDLAFWAHYHAYERTCKLYKGKCTEDGILHLIVGTGGKDVDADVWYDKDWSIFRSNDYGYGRVTVSNYSAILFEWIQNRSKKVVDSVWLLK